MERSCVLPTTQFAYRKGLDTCDALLYMSHALQSALESRHEARIVQIDFSAAFDRTHHRRILHKLCSMGIEVSVLSTLPQFPSKRSQHAMVDTCRSAAGQCFGKAIVPPVHLGAFGGFVKPMTPLS